MSQIFKPVSANDLPSNVPTSFVTNSGVATPSGNIIQILGGAGTTTSGLGNIITVTVTAAAFTWNVVTSALNPITLVPENGYITKGAGSVQFILPAAASVGDTYRIVGYGNLWTIAQNANQQMFLGIASTTVGAGGSFSALTIKDCVEIVCVTANLEFVVTDSEGNILVT